MAKYPIGKPVPDSVRIAGRTSPSKDPGGSKPGPRGPRVADALGRLVPPKRDGAK